MFLLSLYILKNEDNLLHLNSHLLKSNGSNQIGIHINNFNYDNKIELDQQRHRDDNIIIFAYAGIIIGIVFPNINQIDWI